MRRILPALMLAVMACAGGSTAAAPGPRHNVIEASELATHTGTARQAIERLRPRFLRVRGPTSVTNPNADRIIVYVDNSRMGGVEVLDQLQVIDIAEIRYMSAPDATSRYGMGHAAGAILIMLK